MLVWTFLFYGFPFWGNPLISNPPSPEFSDTIQWTASKKLEWIDFKAEAPRSRYAAFTFTVITMDYSLKSKGNSIDAKFEVTAAFNREKSWVKNDAESRSDAIRAHEQLHFDIAELNARKLRRRLVGLKLSRNQYKKEIQLAYDAEIEEGERLQKLYDSETNHGIDRDAQMRWRRRIDKELGDLNEFSRP
jgi:hypothetical protein